MGATARAMKTMGFDDLCLVAPERSHTEERAMKLARAGEEVLANARVCETLDDALVDIDLVIGTSIRQRARTKKIVDSRDLVSEVQARGQAVSSIAILFGPERTGLTNAELHRCDWLSTVPTINTQPSLNLAQAVNIYCYELSQPPRVVASPPKFIPEGLGKEAEYRYLKESISQLMERIGIEKSDWQHNRILHRLADIDIHDLPLAHNLRNRLVEYLDERVDRSH
jgi:tRNA/rRNA methyltransferase